jgi:hypothetical protein
LTTKTLIALVIVVALLIGSFIFGRATAPKPTVIADTVRIHHYTTVETSFRLDTVQAYLRLKSNNARLQSVNLKLQRYSDSLKKFIDEPNQLIASLDTLLTDTSKLHIDYYFPPINSFNIDYQARPIKITRDTIFIMRIKPVEIYKEKLWWVAGSMGYSHKDLNIGILGGIKNFGIGYQLFPDRSPNYMVIFRYP